MAFIQSCFIRKNTRELRARLYNLRDRSGKGFWDCNFNTLLVAYPTYYTNLDDEWGNAEALIKNGVIDCDRNEEMFLAIAALRDGSDFMQLFMLPEGRIGKCPYDTWQDMWGVDLEGVLPKKLSLEEIISYFDPMYKKRESDKAAPNITEALTATPLPQHLQVEAVDLLREAYNSLTGSTGLDSGAPALKESSLCRRIRKFLKLNYEYRPN